MSTALVFMDNDIGLEQEDLLQIHNKNIMEYTILLYKLLTPMME